jgi:hypothetical protein
MLEETSDKSYGWIFFYNSKRYLKKGNPLEALGGTGSWHTARSGPGVVAGLVLRCETP